MPGSPIGNLVVIVDSVGHHRSGDTPTGVTSGACEHVETMINHASRS